MTIHSKNETLMCKVFPFSLGPVAMRWFDGLQEGYINSFKELTWAFRAHFVTCSRVPRPLNSLLSMTMWEEETLKTYSDDVAIRTFKVGLPAEHDLRNFLIRKPVRNVSQLMDCIDEYKQVEDDQ